MTPLTFLLGKPGSGKSTEIARRVKTLAENGEKVFLLVPDQYSATTERFFIGILGDRLFSQVRVMTFKRLFRYVFERTGNSHTEYLTAGGRTALCAKALKAAAPDFLYYPSDYYDMDFIGLLAKAFSSFLSSGVDPEALYKAAELEENEKLRDIAAIYMRYKGYLDEGIFDPEDDYAKIGSILEKAPLFDGASVFVDQFTSLNSRERPILAALCRGGAKVTVSLPCENLLPDDGYSLFSHVVESGRRLGGLLNKQDLSYRVEKLDRSLRWNDPELKFLAENLFSDSSLRDGEIPSSIRISRTADLYDEVEACACEIARLVAEEGYRYSDIVVCARSVEPYIPYLTPVFSSYGIPFFSHKKTSLRSKSPVALISDLLDIAVEGYSSDRTLDMLKTGFLDVAGEEEALFQTYVETWAPVGDRFLHPFLLGVSGFGEPDSEEQRRKLEKVNGVRETLLSRIRPFVENCSGKTVKELSVLLYQFITSVGLEQKLTDMAEDYRKLGETGLYEEQVQVYDMLIDAMDELCSVAGSDPVSVEEYRDLLLSAIDAGDIGIIPTSLDEVMTGDLDKLPFCSPRCLFILGLTEGSFPREIVPDPLINEEETIALDGYGIEYGMTLSQRLLFERFLAYTAFTAPSDRLVLSYARSAGKLSPYLEEVEKRFPSLREQVSPYISGEGYEERIRSESSAFSLMTRIGSPRLQEYFSRIPKYAELMTCPDRASDLLSEEVSRSLFGNRMSLSASRVDRFYQCSFSYFCRYGLNLEKKRAARLDALETGNFIHVALEDLVPKLRGDDPSELLSARVADFGGRYLKKLFGKEEASASFLGYYGQLLRKLDRLLLLFRDEWLNTSFTPQKYELEIKDRSELEPIELPVKDGSVSLTGKIDRMDTYEKDGRTYVRVIDYKSGKKAFDLRNVYQGIDVQMLMYLHSLTEAGKYPFGASAVPAGVLYVNVNPVIVTAARGETEDEIEAQILKHMTRSGLFLHDNEILQAMDSSKGRKYLPVPPNAKDDLSLATSEKFGRIFEHIEKLLSRMGEDLLEGRIGKNPVSLLGSGQDTACRFCDYAPYCERTGCEGASSKALPKDPFTDTGKEASD